MYILFRTMLCGMLLGLSMQTTFALPAPAPIHSDPGATEPDGAEAGTVKPAAITGLTPMKEDPVHIHRWRSFYRALVQLHTTRLAQRPLQESSVSGGYANLPDFYVETTYTDPASSRVWSRIRYETAQPDRIHSIEVYIYDRQGHLQRDYLAAWLPHFRNAPVQTLINLHSPDPDLRAYRQFDASGARIYEQCRGRHFDSQVFLSLEEDELPAVSGAVPRDVDAEIYTACFNGISVSVDPWLNPLAEINSAPSRAASTAEMDDDQVIVALSRAIARQPERAGLYVQRGDRYFAIQQFEAASNDYSSAIALDAQLDQAWFGRGMARGRAGQLEAAIADLGVYLQRHPDDARAWTKRGVRHIWAGQLAEAERDLRQALRLDPDHAEAHDDLGVIYAQRGNYPQAIRHFRQTILNDPDYQKGHHNLATAYFLTGNTNAALQAVDAALRLRGDARNSVLLKGEILQRLGRNTEAEALYRQAAQLPEGNWSENWAIERDE